jgi:hypothetical protein
LKKTIGNNTFSQNGEGFYFAKTYKKSPSKAWNQYKISGFFNVLKYIIQHFNKRGEEA